MVIPTLDGVLGALGGGALIGLSASLFLLSHGRVAGISGILAGAITGTPMERATRCAFLVGLVGAGFGLRALLPEAFGAGPSTGLAIAAGVLVGYGTRTGHGCTSGHGVCGLSRGSLRSLVATLTFIGTGVATVAALRLFGGTP